jgi:diguanylate cyclase (GGDEF)-like protein/PAS domain S-box-containing protein
MVSTWQPLIGNLAVVALFISGWVHGQFLLVRFSQRSRSIAFGLVMGLGAVTSMLMAVRLEGGVLLDLRTSLIALSAFFGGPISGLVTAGIAIALRVYLGGPAVWAGAAGIMTAFLAGWLVERVAREGLSSGRAAILLAGSVACIGPTIGLAWNLLGLQPSMLSSPEQWAFNAAATAVSAFFMLQSARNEYERDLLRTAFQQAGDYYFVKSPEGRFVVVNYAVARHHGFSHPAQMVGLTDADLEPPERAAKLMAEEAEIVATGRPLINLEETVAGSSGDPVIYETSKLALRGLNGAVIGIAGRTMNITARRQMENELKANRDRLDHVLTEMTDGVAMFGPPPDLRLQYCNDQYRVLFPRTAHMRKPGTPLRDILREAARTGEETPPPGVGLEDWIAQVEASMAEPSERDIVLADGRAISERSRVTLDGSSLTVVADVTQRREAELALQQMTDQLKRLATTDGLTGLVNRRTFDATLENEVLRVRRGHGPLSLLMIDVDRFKAYNDLYGHPAGDSVLKQVGAALNGVLRRPTDVAARYGGEEFAAILPGVDEDGAFIVADAFCQDLRARRIVHGGGAKGIVTASVGIATFVPPETAATPEELLRRADLALYNAKGAGRDRVMGWMPRLTAPQTKRA